MNAAGDGLVSFSSVTKRYGSLTAVDNVSFDVERGEYLALLGPNGAGKSTIVKMLLDMVHPTSGAISIAGRPSREPAGRVRVGYLAENHRIPPHLSGVEYLNRHASLCGLSSPERGRQIPALIEMVGMKGRERSRARTYSKGMVQRMGLAAALLGDPRLLVLDEPVGGLDPIGIREIRAILESLRSRSVTVILNSHLLSEVEKTCDTAAIVNRGRIVAQGSISELLHDGETLEDLFVRVVKGPDA